MSKKVRKSNAKKKKVNRKPLHWFKKALLYLFLVFGFVLFAYISYLDYTIREQFESKRWSIPARVYASPVEIFQGYKTSADAFEALLQQLHYRRDDRLSFVATYYKKGQEISLKTRPFNFWDKQQDSQSIKIKFLANSIQQITNLKTAKVVPLLRMDPAQIGSFYPTRKEDRILIKLENTPAILIQGLLATEDHNFYQHFGLFFKSIARTLWANMRAETVVQGEITITQKLVKNFYLSAEKHLWRKINEAFMALILEYHYQKDEILEIYLNEIYLGQDGTSAVHGFGLASEFYFAQPLKNLPLEDIATLVALVRSPSYYDPRRYPDLSIKRRNLVLDAMHKRGHITKKQMLVGKQKKLTVLSSTYRPVNRYPSFLDLVKRQLRQEYGEDDLTSEGLRIFTTLDTQIQNVLETTLTRTLRQLEKKPESNRLETANIITRRDNGEIVALAGGRKPQNVDFNRALDVVRPIGSLIKPMIYLTALEYPNRYTLATPISDTAIDVKDKNGKIWKPKNYDHKEHGEIPFHTALTYSYNLATVHLGMDIGLGRIAKTLRNMGVSRPVDLFPSLLLGESPLTPLEVTQLYQTLAGDGFATPLRSIQAVIAADGGRLQRYSSTVRQAVDPSATYLTNKILQQAMSIGTGQPAYLHIPKTFALVGKTGTTNNLRDSWFAGFSGDYLSVVWVGRDDNKPSGLTGSSGALQIWLAMMKHISTKPVDLIPPDNIEIHWIDPTDGLLANESCEGAIVYSFIKGSEPEQYSPCVSTSLNKAKTWFNDFIKDNF